MFKWHHIQTVKTMLSKCSNTQSFQEVLADLRITHISTGLPSLAEILRGRNLVTKTQTEIDIRAIRSLLQERQLKMTLSHDSSRRAKKARPLVVDLGINGLTLSLQVSLTVAGAMTPRWKQLEAI